MKIKTMIYLLLLPALVLSGCKKMELSSAYLDREITVDGNHSDWQGALTYLEKKNISLGLLNDDKYLYVCLATNDRKLKMQMLRMGFTIWFDAAGGSKKNFGIHYPLGLIDKGIPMRDRMKQRQDESMAGLSTLRLSEFEILGPEKEDKKRYRLAEIKELKLELNNQNDMLVYELKVPLFKDGQNPIAIGAGEGQAIGMGLEIPEIDFTAMGDRESRNRNSAGDGLSGGRMGGRGGMRGRGRRGGMSGRGGGMQGERPQISEPLKIWAKVQLAGTK